MKIWTAGVEGQRISKICFVEDYLEIGLADGGIFRPLGSVELIASTGDSAANSQKFASDIRGLIGEVVVEVTEVPGTEVALVTRGGTVVRVPLNVEGESGTEALHYIPAGTEGQLDLRRMRIWHYS